MALELEEFALSASTQGDDSAYNGDESLLDGEREDGTMVGVEQTLTVKSSMKSMKSLKSLTVPAATSMDDEKVELLLSTKLMNGFMLLDKPCPKCMIPLVKQPFVANSEGSFSTLTSSNQDSSNPAIENQENQDEDDESGETPRLVTNLSIQGIPKPIRGIPCCALCESYVVTNKSERALLEKLKSTSDPLALEGKGTAEEIASLDTRMLSGIGVNTDNTPSNKSSKGSSSNLESSAEFIVTKQKQSTVFFRATVPRHKRTKREAPPGPTGNITLRMASSTYSERSTKIGGKTVMGLAASQDDLGVEMRFGSGHSLSVTETRDIEPTPEEEDPAGDGDDERDDNDNDDDDDDDDMEIEKPNLDNIFSDESDGQAEEKEIGETSASASTTDDQTTGDYTIGDDGTLEGEAIEQTLSRASDSLAKSSEGDEDDGEEDEEEDVFEDMQGMEEEVEGEGIEVLKTEDDSDCDDLELQLVSESIIYRSPDRKTPSSSPEENSEDDGPVSSSDDSEGALMAEAMEHENNMKKFSKSMDTADTEADETVEDANGSEKSKSEDDEEGNVIIKTSNNGNNDDNENNEDFDTLLCEKLQAEFMQGTFDSTDSAIEIASALDKIEKDTISILEGIKSKASTEELTQSTVSGGNSSCCSSDVDTDGFHPFITSPSYRKSSPDNTTGSEKSGNSYIESKDSVDDHVMQEYTVR